MRKTNDFAAGEPRNMYIGILSTLVFAILMGSFIVYFYESEPSLKGQILFRLGDQLEDSAITAHWQWQSEGRPQRIIVVHYNNAGKEKDRRPVLMDISGWPEVRRSDEGCRELWQVLLNQPLEVDGFKVRGKYSRSAQDEGEPDNAWCRFSVNSGDYFDYAIYRGEVTYDD